MIKVSILYPNNVGSRFDADYYVDTHMPMTLAKLGDAIKGVSVEMGKSGEMPDQAPAYIAMCHFICETPEAFYTAFMPHMDALQNDMPNYTDVEPVIQFSEIVLSR